MANALFPGLLGEICDIAGQEAALAIAVERGGTRVDIPAKVDEQHWLSQCVGFELAKKICTELATTSADGFKSGVLHETLPMGPTSHAANARRILYEELRNGTSVRKAALKAGVHERTAFRANAKLKSNTKQLNLF